MAKVKFWVDGKEVEAEEGKSILFAALDAGIYIPHLCTHPDLEPQGGCKLCVIQIDGADPVTSCTTKVSEGIHVVTKNELLDKIRRFSMQFMLAGHPQCTGCRSFGVCEFQALHQYTSTVANPEMREIPKAGNKINTVNPLIDREMERCIQCGRCVRVCNDIRGVKVLKYNKIKETGEAYIGTEGDLPLDASMCRFCGACVEVCPTGALQDKEGVFRTDIPRDQALIPCVAECPAGVNIPEYIRQIAFGEYSKAVAIVREKVPFPHSLGDVCTSFCQKKCKRKGLNGAVDIKGLKRFAAEHDTEKIWYDQYIKTAPPTGKKVAVVGGGPCGLTAAYYLAKKGHDVTVLERYPTCGGMMSYGIPSYRIPREDVQEEVDVIKATGVKIQTNCEVKNINDVKKDYDAVLVTIGASDGKIIPVANMDREMCTTAIDILRDIAMGKETTPKIGPGVKVLVYGGGNVAFDAARSSRRLGADVSVVCLEAREQMTADDEEIDEAKEEGIAVYPGQSNNGFIVDENGKMKALACFGISSFKFGPNGLEVEKIEGTEHEVECDVVVFASGQKTNITADFGLELNRPGYPIDPKTGKSGFETSVPGVYAAGDVITGTKAVINAIAGGREAASKLDVILGGDGNIEEKLVDVEPLDPFIGQIQDFASIERVKPEVAPCDERQCSFIRVDRNFTEEQARIEATRCLKCPLRTQINKTELWTAYEA